MNDVLYRCNMCYKCLKNEEENGNRNEGISLATMYVSQAIDLLKDECLIDQIEIFNEFKNFIQENRRSLSLRYFSDKYTKKLIISDIEKYLVYWHKKFESLKLYQIMDIVDNIFYGYRGYYDSVDGDISEMYSECISNSWNKLDETMVTKYGFNLETIVLEWRYLKYFDKNERLTDDRFLGYNESQL